MKNSERVRTMQECNAAYFSRHLPALAVACEQTTPRFIGETADCIPGVLLDTLDNRPQNCWHTICD